MNALEVIKKIGCKVGIKWESVEFTPEQLAQGMKEEYEHGSKDQQTDVTNDDPIATAKIAWIHLKEDPKYYDKLSKVMKKSLMFDTFRKTYIKRILKANILNKLGIE